MKLEQTKVMLSLLALISTVIFQPSEAQPLCVTRVIDNEPGCFDAIRLAAKADFRWLNRGCCEAVRSLPDTCLLLVVPGQAYPTNIFKSICINKFPEVRPNPNILCSKNQTAPIDNEPGCFDAVRLAADGDIRWLSRDCCKAVERLPDCLLLVFPTKALTTNIFRSICIRKFPGSIL